MFRDPVDGENGTGAGDGWLSAIDRWWREAFGRRGSTGNEVVQTPVDSFGSEEDD